jgi:adenylosuccinate lyase
VIPEAFMAIDAILMLYGNIATDLVLYPKVIEEHLRKELPFMATENILMAAVKKGGDRQALHERIRQHSLEAARRVKEKGQSNDLLERIARDPAFSLTEEELDDLMKPDRYIGRAPQQVEAYIESIIDPFLDGNPESVITESPLV